MNIQSLETYLQTDTANGPLPDLPELQFLEERLYFEPLEKYIQEFRNVRSSVEGKSLAAKVNKLFQDIRKVLLQYKVGRKILTSQGSSIDITKVIENRALITYYQIPQVVEKAKERTNEILEGVAEELYRKAEALQKQKAEEEARKAAAAAPAASSSALPPDDTSCTSSASSSSEDSCDSTLINESIIPARVGLPNLKATCYLNSALQLIVSSGLSRLFATEPENPNAKNLFQAFKEIEHKMRFESVSKGDMERLYGLLQRNGWQPAPTQMCEVDELLQFLFTTLCTVEHKNYQSFRILDEQGNPISEIEEKSPFLELRAASSECSVNLSTTQAGISNYLAGEFIRDFLHEGRRISAIKTPHIKEHSPFLVYKHPIYGFERGRVVKRFHNSEPSLVIELGEALYAAKTIICHVGDGAGSGHYFCYVCVSPGKWKKFDDMGVGPEQTEFQLQEEFRNTYKKREKERIAIHTMVYDRMN